MKKKNLFLVFVTMLVSQSAFAGFTLTCKAWVDMPHSSDVEMNGGLFIGEAGAWICEGTGKLKGNQYLLEMFGLGPSMRIDIASIGTLVCPTVKKSRIEQGYGGVKVSAGALVGGSVVVMFSKRMGACFFTSAALSAGASATIGGYSIKKIEEWHPVE
jgi:hypothetical protein